MGTPAAEQRPNDSNDYEADWEMADFQENTSLPKEDVKAKEEEALKKVREELPPPFLDP